MGVLDLIKEKRKDVEGSGGPNLAKNEMFWTRPRNILYNWGAWLRQFSLGVKVLVLLPLSISKLPAKRQELLVTE